MAPPGRTLFHAYGQLGDNSTTTRKDPVLVSGLTNVIAIAAGEQDSVALTRPWGGRSHA